MYEYFESSKTYSIFNRQKKTNLWLPWVGSAVGSAVGSDVGSAVDSAVAAQITKILSWHNSLGVKILD